jgi:hypothetical protein
MSEKCHKQTSCPVDQVSLPKGHNELTVLFKPFWVLECDYLYAQLNAFITNDAFRLLALRVH